MAAMPMGAGMLTEGMLTENEGDCWAWYIAVTPQITKSFPICWYIDSSEMTLAAEEPKRVTRHLRLYFFAATGVNYKGRSHVQNVFDSPPISFSALERVSKWLNHRKVYSNTPYGQATFPDMASPPRPA